MKTPGRPRRPDRRREDRPPQPASRPDSRSKFRGTRQSQSTHKQQLEVGQQLTVGIDSMTLEGQCVARVDGFVLFVSGAIPGEQVTVEITSLGRDFGRAGVTEVIDADEQRIEPRCPHFGVCGGCTWQHIAYPEQLQWKAELLRSILEHRLPGVKLPLRPVIGVPDPWGTRNKIHYTVRNFGQGRNKTAKLCHHRGNSTDLEVIRECPVHQRDGDEIARRAFLWLRERGVDGATPHSTDAALKSILVRTAGATAQSHVVFVATSVNLPGVESVAKSLIELPNVAGVHLNVQPDASSTWLGRETKHLAGAERLVEDVGGIAFHVTPDTFFQTNAVAAGKLLDTVTAHVPKSAHGSVLDLYSGVGLFSLPLARAGHDVTAVEENVQAVNDGRLTAKLNGINGCRFHAMRTQDYLKKESKERRFETVILDPPRDGCPEWAIRLIGRGVRPRRIINVSCNPQALATDLAVLTKSGYRIREIQPLDMFPQTAHIESVTLLERV